MKGNKNKNGFNMLPGQLTLWDIEITEKPKNITENVVLVTENPILDTNNEEKSPKISNSFTKQNIPDKQQQAMDKYKESPNLSRIIEYCGGGVGIELLHGDGYKTIYVNAEGKEEFTSIKKIPVLPMDEIVYYKDPKVRFSNIQEEKLKELQQSTPGAKVIKRKADENILVELQDKVISINPQGWVLEFKGCKAVYKEDEVELHQDPSPQVSIEDIQRAVKLRDIVEAQHGERTIIGEIVHVYGPGNVTLNIAFDNYTKETAVHRSRITKLIKCA
jgi:hypothetical protein